MGKHFSNKHFNKKRRRNVRGFETAEIIEFQHSKFDIERSLPPLLPLNPAQGAYIDALRTSPQVIVLGPAGNGADFVTEFAKTLQFVNQGPTTYPESFRGFRPIEAVLEQRLDDGMAFDFLQTLWVHRFGGRGWMCRRSRARRQVFRQNHFTP